MRAALDSSLSAKENAQSKGIAVSGEAEAFLWQKHCTLR